MKKLFWLLFAIAIVGIFAAAGCRERKDPVAPPQEVPQTEEETAAAVTVEQEICPVMGNPINEDLFVEYEGKRVYFCCAMCIPEFEKNPEKYLSKLPQFQN